MSKKIVLMITLIVFIGVTFSCNTAIKRVRVHGPAAWQGKNAKILTVYTKSKKLFEFSEKKPAKIVGNNIVGQMTDKTGEKKEVSIPLSEARVMWVKKIDAESIILTPFAIIGVVFTSAIVIGTVASG